MPRQKKADSLIPLVEMTNKDVGLSLSPSVILTENDLLKELTRAIDYLIDKDFEKLMQTLYRIDVSETKVKQAFGLDQDVAQQLARLIVEREQQKIITRAKYRGI